MAVSKATNESIMDIMYMYTICTKNKPTPQIKEIIWREKLYTKHLN